MLHKTKGGEFMPIALMDDSHLMNTIKLPFKKYLNVDNVKTSFLLGKSFDKITVEKYNNIIHNIYMYVIEGLRRKSTRSTLMEFLSQFNPIFLTEEIEVNTFNLKILESNNDEDDDEYQF